MNFNLAPKITETCMKRMQEFREEKIYCDVTLISNNGNVKVDAHRIVLSAASEYFLAMFRTPMKEYFKEDVNMEVDGKTLTLVVDYIYSASIELTPDTVEDVLKAAHLFEIASLKTICSNFMAKRLETSNCLGIYIFAERYGLVELLERSINFVCEHFMEITKSEEFLNLDVDQLCKLFASDELQVDSEEDVFRSLQLWVNYDAAQRRLSMDKLLQHIRFQVLSPEFIADKIEPECKTIECIKIISEAFKWHSISKHQLMYPEKVVNQRSGKVLFTLYCWDKSTNTLNTKSYSSKLGKWICNLVPLPPCDVRNRYRTITFEGKLIMTFMISSESGKTSTAYSFDLRTSKWTPFASLTKPMHSLKMFEFDRSLYTIGGITSKDYRGCTVDKWNSTTNQWTTVFSLSVYPSNLCTDSILFTYSTTLLCISIYDDNKIWHHFVYDKSLKLSSTCKQTYSETLFLTRLINDDLLLNVFHNSTILFNWKSNEVINRASIEPPIDEKDTLFVWDDRMVTISKSNCSHRQYKYNEHLKSWEGNTVMELKLPDWFYITHS